MQNKGFQVTKIFDSQIKTLIRQINAENGKIDAIIRSKMNQSVAWMKTTARLRRPDIYRIGNGKTGSVEFRVGRSSKPKGAVRVSDPGAESGVPVRTGLLRSSIESEIIKKGGKTIGKVYTTGAAEYDITIEFGNSRIAPRPFMRPALNLNEERIKELFKNA